MTWEPVRPELRRSARLVKFCWLKTFYHFSILFQTTYSKQCSTVYDNKCQNIPAQECKAGYQSRKHLNIFIIHLYDICVSLLWPFHQTIYKNKCRYDKQCSTSYSKKCTKVGGPFYKRNERITFYFRFRKKTVKPSTTKNAPKSPRRIVGPRTLRNASRPPNKTVRLFMTNSVKKFPRTTAKMSR